MVADASALHAHAGVCARCDGRLSLCPAVAPVRVCLIGLPLCRPGTLRRQCKGTWVRSTTWGCRTSAGRCARRSTSAPGLQGVERDLKTAVKWYHKAAEAGNSGAQFNLGNCYKRGEGYVPPPIAACPRAVAHAASAAARRLRQAGVVRENSRCTLPDMLHIPSRLLPPTA